MDVLFGPILLDVSLQQNVYSITNNRIFPESAIQLTLTNNHAILLTHRSERWLNFIAFIQWSNFFAPEFISLVIVCFACVGRTLQNLYDVPPKFLGASLSRSKQVTAVQVPPIPESITRINYVSHG